MGSSLFDAHQEHTMVQQMGYAQHFPKPIPTKHNCSTYGLGPSLYATPPERTMVQPMGWVMAWDREVS